MSDKKIKENERKIKKDKYGVEFDSWKMIDSSPAASVNEYTGIVPVAIENGAEEESYEDMMCVDLGKYRKKRDIKNVAYPKDNKQHKNERSK